MLKKYSQLKQASSGTKMNNRAVKEYGLTTNPESMGFIMPNGKCIDSSGQRQGSRSPGRNIDHRQIATAGIGEEAAYFDSLHAMLNHFIYTTGNIRVVSITDEVNIQIPLKDSIPTRAQTIVLERISKGKPVVFDITDKAGNNLSSGNGRYFEFVNTLSKIKKEEHLLRQDKDASAVIPRQLLPLAEFVKEHFNTVEEYREVHFDPKHPLFPALRRAEKKTGLGVTKIWRDFGFNSNIEFFNAVQKM